MSGLVSGYVGNHRFPDVGPGPGRRCGVTGKTIKLVALCIANKANDDGANAHPSIRQLADWAQCHTATAGRAVHALVELGYLEVTAPGTERLATTYAFNRDAFAVKQGRGRPGDRGPRAIGTAGSVVQFDGVSYEHDGARWVEVAQA
jgi:hypothetical protein